MTKVIKLPKDRLGNAYYPATVTDAIVHPTKKQSLTEIIDNIKDVKIVDSVDKLDPDAPSGSLATVSNINTEEIEVEDKFSVRDIYVEENPDCEPLMELKLKVPETWPTEQLNLVFGQKGYNSSEEVAAGNSLFLILIPEGVNVGIYINGEPTVVSDLILSNSVNEELLNEVNDTISSWGGIVFYGTFMNEPSLMPPTDSQTDYVDSIIGYNNGTHIETTETHVNDIYFKETTGWRKINDVKIIDSVDKLDKNAPQGSLATVAVDTFGEISFSELYQPTEENVDLDLPPIHKYSRVNGISVIAPDPSIQPPEFEVDLFSEDFNPENNIGTVICLFSDGCAELYNMANSSQNMELNLLIYNEEENTLTINEENLAELNNILSEKNYFYAGTYGPTNEDGDWGLIDPSISDYIYRAISGVQKTDLYIKDVEGWKVVGDEELKAKVDNLETIVDNLEDTVNNLEDKTDLIVNSVDELPEDAPIGTLANILNPSSYIKFSEVYSRRFENGQDLNTLSVPDDLIVSFPEKVDSFSALPSGPIGFPMSYIIAGSMVLPGNSSYRIFMNGTSIRMETWMNNFKNDTITLATYDSSGNRLTANQENIESVQRRLRGSYFPTSIPESDLDLLDRFLFFGGPKCTTLYVKNETGWEQYSELVDGSVTTEKVVDGAITIAKLEQSIQDSITKVNTFFDAADQSDEVIDTLKEIQEYIESDESGAAAMVESIASNKNEIEQLKQKIQYLTEEEYNTLITEGKINEDVIYIVTYN